MPGARVSTINGITYPRDVPVLDGMPEGWKGVEQVYGASSRYNAGQTYVRYSSLPDTYPKLYRQLAGPKQVIQAHCEEMGLDWEPMYAEYQRLQEEKKEREKEAREREREAQGLVKGQERENLIQLSRDEFGELTGPLCLALPGWKCRWDYAADTSGQTCKTFTDDRGNEWKLLKDVEAMIGKRLKDGGEPAEKVREMMVTAKARLPEIEVLFSTGTQGAKMSESRSYEIDPSEGAGRERTAEDLAAQAERKEARALQRKRKQRSGLGSGKEFLIGFVQTIPPVPHDGWAELQTAEDREKGFAEFRELLSKRGFTDIELLAVVGVDEACRWFPRVRGAYYKMPAPCCGRPCFQRLLHAPLIQSGIACDRVYIL